MFHLLRMLRLANKSMNIFSFEEGDKSLCHYQFYGLSINKSDFGS